MSTATLNNLLEYLYGTLSTNNMRWVAEHLIEHADRQDAEQMKPYTMEELNARIDKAEKQITEGLSRDHEEVFQELEKEFSHIAEAV